MKNAAEFNVGDKVFAKVKGYPAWPAIIIEDQNKKYNVRFYGTGETGIVKAKDMFYYTRHKSSFPKNQKRKGYREAIEEIEQAIRECGTDGDPREDFTDGMASNEVSVNDSTNSNKVVKRKRSESRTVSESSSEIQDHKKEATVAKKAPETSSKKPDNLNGESHTSSEQMEENPIKSEVMDSDVPLGIADIKIITDEFLQNIVEYGDYVKQHQQIYKYKPPEKRKKVKNELLLVKLPEGTFIGVKYNHEVPPPMKNECDLADYEAGEAKTLLSLKKLIEQGSCKPEDEPQLFVTNINITDEEITDAIQREEILRKKAKLEWLRTESHLITLDNKIKSCLGLDKADPKAALEHLDEMLHLNVEPLMLKKHPAVVDMIKRLCKYIGNVKEWNMTEEECEEFEMDAEKVRSKAHDVFKKFAELFNIAEPARFWSVFYNEVDVYRQLIKDMEEAEIIALSTDPISRQAFFDVKNEKEEMKVLAEKMERIANESLEKENMQLDFEYEANPQEDTNVL